MNRPGSRRQSGEGEESGEAEKRLDEKRTETVPVKPKPKAKR
jgi:hypothetical protein